MKRPSHRLEPIVRPRAVRAGLYSICISQKQRADLELCATRLGVVRLLPDGKRAASVSALLEAISDGLVGVVRLDDPARQIVRAVGISPTVDPRCPQDWED
jgi:hypothetical protein